MTKRLLVVKIYCHAIIVSAMLSYPLAAFILIKQEIIGKALDKNVVVT